MTKEHDRRTLTGTGAAYRNQDFPGEPRTFEALSLDGRLRTAFTSTLEHRHALTSRTATEQQVDEMLSSSPSTERRSGFASAASSQALCHSVFGGLNAMEQISALEGIKAEDGRPAFFDRVEDGPGPRLELTVDTLNEPRPTDIDAYFSGSHRVAVEVKFADSHIDTVLRRHMAHDVRYRDYVPRLFHGSVDADAHPHSLASTYQLVRNLVAVGLNADGSLETDNAHVLVLYDDRNPGFAPGGAADRQWQQTLAALRFPQMLRRLSWQHLAGHLAVHQPLEWLVDGLRRKYGIIGRR
jgi:hypothetical protein